MSGLVRVSVTSASRRVDLVLPAAVPVADLVPELARSVGVLAVGTAHAGYRLVTPDGRVLDPEAGLAAQGVEDGGVLTVAAGADVEQPLLHDDVVEAMAEAVDRDLRPWDAVAARRTALLAAVLLLLVGAVGLGLQYSSFAAAASAAVAASLVGGAVALSRVGGPTEVAVGIAGTGCVYAATTGMLLARGSPLSGTTCAAAGAGALVAAVVAGLGLPHGRPFLLPPVVVGAILLTTGLLTQRTSYDPAGVLSVLLTLVVLGNGVVPWLALAATGPAYDVLVTDDPGVPAEIDLSTLRADARIAHEVLLAAAVSVGLLLVAVAPLAVTRGPAGAVVAVLCCLVVLVRTRGQRDGVEVLVGLASGVLGLVSTAVAVLWLQPAWRPVASLVLAASGMAALVPGGTSPRWARCVEVVETAALLALPPVLMVACGAVTAVRG